MKRAAAVVGTWLGFGAVLGVLAFAGVCRVVDRQLRKDANGKV